MGSWRFKSNAPPNRLIHYWRTTVKLRGIRALDFKSQRRLDDKVQQQGPWDESAGMIRRLGLMFITQADNCRILEIARMYTVVLLVLLVAVYHPTEAFLFGSPTSSCNSDRDCPIFNRFRYGFHALVCVFKSLAKELTAISHFFHLQSSTGSYMNRLKRISETVCYRDILVIRMSAKSTTKTQVYWNW